MPKSNSFRFDGGAATYLGTILLSMLVTLITFGVAYPYALVLRHRWKAKHTYVDGRQLRFVGSGTSLFLNWVKWLALIIVTFGIYSLWVFPRITKWVVEHTDFAEPAPTATFTVN